jgi:hypothetical protein
MDRKVKEMQNFTTFIACELLNLSMLNIISHFPSDPYTSILVPRSQGPLIFKSTALMDLQSLAPSLLIILNRILLSSYHPNGGLSLFPLVLCSYNTIVYNTKDHMTHCSLGLLRLRDVK